MEYNISIKIFYQTGPFKKSASSEAKEVLMRDRMRMSNERFFQKLAGYREMNELDQLRALLLTEDKKQEEKQTKELDILLPAANTGVFMVTQ